MKYVVCCFLLYLVSCTSNEQNLDNVGQANFKIDSANTSNFSNASGHFMAATYDSGTVSSEFIDTIHILVKSGVIVEEIWRDGTKIQLNAKLDENGSAKHDEFGPVIIKIISEWSDDMNKNLVAIQKKSAFEDRINQSENEKTSKPVEQIICMMCGGTGSGENVPLYCMNCLGWSDEYKRKVPCHECKDTRIVYKKKCNLCNGKGKIDRDAIDIKNIDQSQNSKRVFVPPVSNEPMSDEDALKLYNSNIDPALQNNSTIPPARPRQNNNN